MQVRLHDEIVVDRLGSSLLLILLLTVAVLEIFHGLACGHVGSQVALLVGIEFRLQVDGQESLVRENLRTGTLEMVIDHFHAVHLSLAVQIADFLGNSNAVIHVGLVGERREVPGRLESEFCRLLSHLSSDGIDDDIFLAEMFVLVDGLLHLLDDVGIETAAERGVAGIDDQGHALHRACLEERAAQFGFRG